MITNGLVPEIKGLLSHLLASNADLSQFGLKGITQAIGFKEFQPYFKAAQAGLDQEELDTILKACVVDLNAATRQYAKRQLTWIRNRFAPRNIPVYKLDTTDTNVWNEVVLKQALEISKAFLENKTIPVNSMQLVFAATENTDDEIIKQEKKKKFICETCLGREFVGGIQWNEHLRSKGHRFHLKRIRLLENPHDYSNFKMTSAERTEIEKQ